MLGKMMSSKNKEIINLALDIIIIFYGAVRSTDYISLENKMRNLLNSINN